MRAMLSIIVSVVSIAGAMPAFADAPSSRPSPRDLATPVESLLAYDHWCTDLQDFNDTAAFYYATTDQEKAFVQKCLKSDRVEAALERLSRKNFGPEGCTAILHEVGEPDDNDLRSANVAINRNIAIVRIPIIQFELQMINVNGQWLADAGHLIQSYGGVESGIKNLETNIAQLQPIVDGLQSDKYKTAKEVIDAIDHANQGQS